MTYVSYAQNFEDVVLMRAFADVGQGVYIDVGAQDPTIDSVSRAFYDRGWRGVHVEPSAHYAQLLREARPRDTVIQAAVTDQPGLVTFFEIPGSGISTIDPDIAKGHHARGHEIVEHQVAAMPLSVVLAQCAGLTVHWLKLDVEGAELAALRSWGKEPLRPLVVVVESTLPMTQIPTHESWERLLLTKGYKFAYFDGLNRYYVLAQEEQLRARLAKPPNVFDDFELHGGASAPFHRGLLRKLDAAVAQGEEQKFVLLDALASVRRDADGLREQVESARQLQAAHEEALQALAAARAALESSQGGAEQLRCELAAAQAREATLQERLADASARLAAEAQDHHLQLARQTAMHLELQRAMSATHVQEIERGDTQWRHRWQVLHQGQQQMLAQALEDHARTLQSAQSFWQADAERREQARRQAEAALAAELARRDESLRELGRVFAGESDLLRQQAAEALRRQADDADARLRAMQDELRQARAAHDTSQAALAAERDRVRQEALQLSHHLRAARAAAEADLRDALAHRQAMAQGLDLVSRSLWWRLWARVTRGSPAGAAWAGAQALTQQPPAGQALHLLLQEAPPAAPPTAETTLRIAFESPKMDIDPVMPGSLEELLALHDEPFVSHAYRLVLGREPDPQGLAAYLRQVRDGAPKERLVLAMALSEEGRTHGARLPGLPALLERGDVPSPGRMARRFQGWLSAALAPTEAHLRAIRNQQYRQEGFGRETRDRLTRVEAALQELHGRLASAEQRQPVEAPAAGTPAPRHEASAATQAQAMLGSGARAVFARWLARASERPGRG